MPKIRRIVADLLLLMMMMWLNLLVLAQTTTSPDEKLVNSFNGFVSAINTMITGMSAVIALLALVVAIGVPIWVGKIAQSLRQQAEDRVAGTIAQANRDVERAIGGIDRTVQEQVRLQVETLRRRTRYLENLLAREATIEQTMVNYFVPNPLPGMPEGYQILSTRLDGRNVGNSKGHDASRLLAIGLVGNEPVFLVHQRLPKELPGCLRSD
jgi:hypothetical protein